MPNDLGLADRLRVKGLDVVEVDGWQTRGRDYAEFNPQGSVNHHTAGALGGNAPSLGICINGRSDLPGPLCNVMQARDNTCYVVAAGVCNHAGGGGWLGLAGNQTVHGLEVENTGYNSTEPWRDDQLVTMAKVHAAFLEWRATPADMVCQHYEWTTAKIDAHDIDGSTFRALVRSYLGAAPLPPTDPDPPMFSEDDDMTLFKELLLPNGTRMLLTIGTAPFDVHYRYIGPGDWTSCKGKCKPEYGIQACAMPDSSVQFVVVGTDGAFHVGTITKEGVFAGFAKLGGAPAPVPV